MTRARVILMAALALGVSGDLLLRGGTWRLGLALWVACGVGLVLVASGLERRAPTRLLLLGGILLAVGGLVVREAELLYAIDFVALLCVGALAVWHAGRVPLARFRLGDAPRACVMTVIALVGGAPALLRSSAGQDGAGASRSARVRTGALGVLLAVPPLLLVALLLGSADPLFGDFVHWWSDLLSQRALDHAFKIVLLSWLAAGWLRSAVGPVEAPALPQLPALRLPFATVAFPLYGLVALLAIFLGLQARVLFGGATYLMETAGLSMAEYARDGFFDLVAVTGVVLGTLLVTDWLRDQSGDAGDGRFRAAGWVLVLLVATLMVSAFTRMALYVGFFGLSTDRLFATAGMVWIAAVLGCFGVTILAGRRERFGPGILAVSALWVASLTVMNPEALVVRTNVARLADGAPFDVAYHATLSADAAPALAAAASRMPAATCEALNAALVARWPSRMARRADWRGWSLPLGRARQLGFGAEGGGPPLRCAGALSLMRRPVVR